MKKFLPRVLCFALIAAMVLSLFGCGSSESKEGTGTSTSGQTKAMEPVAKKEPVTLKLFGPIFWGGPWQNGVQNDAIDKVIQNDTGVTLDVEGQDAEYGTKLAAMIASADLPDIVGLDSTKYLPTLIEGEQIIVMDDYLATNGKNITKYTQRKVDFSRKLLSNGTNKLYALAANAGDGAIYSIESPFWFGRWDLYKKLGYPEYRNFDEFLEVLKKMQDLEPTNAEGKKNYALSLWMADWGTWCFTCLADYLGMYPELPGGYLDVDVETFESKSYILDDSSSLWTSMDFLNKAYKMGILDPESVMQKWDQVVSKGTANRVHAGPFDWFLGGGREAFKKAGTPEKDYVALPMPTDIKRKRDGDVSYYGYMNAIYVISENCRYPDRAVELLDWFHVPDNCISVNFGPKGQTWDYTDGKPQFKDNYFTERAADGETFMRTYSINKYGGLKGLDSSFINPDNGVIIYLESLPEVIKKGMETSTRPALEDFCENYNVEFPVDLYKGKRIPWNQTVKALLPDAPDNIKMIDANIGEYMKVALPQMVIIGDSAKFEIAKKEFKDKCLSMGLQETTDYWIQALKNVVSKMKELDN